MSTSRSATSAPFNSLLTAGFEAFDLLNVGLAVVNPAGHVLHLNQIAEEILKSRDGLYLTRDGALTAVEGDGSSITRLVSHSTKPELPDATGTNDTVLALPRPSGKRALTMVVRSLRGKSLKRHVTGPAAVVFILDPEMAISAADADLRQLYGLTLTEARLANLLLDGNNLDECGAKMGIRRTTVRMHLRNLFVKTGVQRQSELISLLFRSLVPVRSAGAIRKSQGTSVFDLFTNFSISDLETKVAHLTVQDIAEQV
jgi:DNA-binding CsgD family transcriptional regulator